MLANMASRPNDGPATVLDNLKSDVLTGYWKPEQQLVFARLTDRYGTSVGVLREALQRLVEQGIVVTRANLGFQVAPVSVPDLEDLTDARCELEALAIRRSIQNGDVSWEGRVLAAHHVLASTPYTEDASVTTPSNAWLKAHAEFHEALIAACPNKRIRGTASNFRDVAEIYRTWSIAVSTSPRDMLTEHRQLCEAAVSRNEDLAESLIRKHISLTTVNLIDALTRSETTAPQDNSERYASDEHALPQRRGASPKVVAGGS